MQTLHALLSDPGALFNGSIHCVDSPPSIIRFVSFRYYPETPALYCIVLYCIGSKPPPPPQQIRASHDLGLMFQLNGGRALRGTLVAVVVKQVVQYSSTR
jgi:hypothetical protein